MHHGTQAEIYDAVVIGGGPAGGAAATALARQGHRVLLAERQTFPRFHIGESLLPASNRAFRRLGLMDKIRDAEFVQKRGARFSADDASTSVYIDFSATDRVAEPLTFQVPRARFDQLLLDHAEACGAEVRQGSRVKDIDFGPNGVDVQLIGGEEVRMVRARAVIDASGQSGFLAKRMALRQVDPVLRSVAIFAHFEDVQRPTGERAGDIHVISRLDLGWFWLIPISKTVTSIGVVLPQDRLEKLPGETSAETLSRYMESSPLMAELTREARRVSEVRQAADFSYQPKAYAGDRWLLAGDAGSFLDPVFSTGVLVALESGLEAAEAAHRALQRNNLSASSFKAFEGYQRRRYAYFRRFVRGFYENSFRDLFFSPSRRLGLMDAIISALAGNWRPKWTDRLRLAVFFALVKAQKRWSLAPRRYPPSPEKLEKRPRGPEADRPGS